MTLRTLPIRHARSLSTAKPWLERLVLDYRGRMKFLPKSGRYWQV